MRKLLIVGAAALACVVAVAVVLRVRASTSAAATAREAPAAAAAIPVLVATAEAKDVPIILRGLGTVEAFNTVSVKSRVEGAITKINFKEGQEVHTGDVLIELDARPYRAALDQAKAVLVRDQASLANAQADLQRYAKLLQQSFAPEQQYATQKSTVAQGEASLVADQAVIEAAQANVDYASIKSPIDGVTGIRQVDLGNLLQANSQTLVVLTQVKPIYVIFTLPEADIRRVREAMAKTRLSVLAFAAGDDKQIAAGGLDLVDNAVDQTTGTFKLKAEFANDDTALWPGQFVNAHLVLSVVHDGVNVPSAAIQTGPKGPFTYVVKDDSTVDMRAVTVIQTESNMALVGSGLKAGERVVTAGQFKLQAGVKVSVSDRPADVGPNAASDTPIGTSQ
ncbi:MAG: efflux RND transporter periplasmic adaptor subunit [Xanthobacteraceae bacterium]